MAVFKLASSDIPTIMEFLKEVGWLPGFEPENDVIELPEGWSFVHHGTADHGAAYVVIRMSDEDYSGSGPFLFAIHMSGVKASELNPDVNFRVGPPKEGGESGSTFFAGSYDGGDNQVLRVKGTKDDNTILGSQGDDILIGARGDDRIIAGAGDDRIRGGWDDDRLTGGEGADTFVYYLHQTGHDTITDFTVDEDVIRLIGDGADSFGELTIAQVGDDTRITLANDATIVLEDVQASTLDAGDFFFVG